MSKASSGYACRHCIVEKRVWTLIDRLLLFDIDGTLVVTGGAGQRAMNRAFHDVFGIPDAFKGVDLAGRTDTSIVGDAFARQGMEADAHNTARFRERYLVCLQDEVPRPGAGKRVLPGIAPLLDVLRTDAAELPGAADRQLRRCRGGEARALRSVAATSGAARSARITAIATTWCRWR